MLLFPYRVILKLSRLLFGWAFPPRKAPPPPWVQEEEPPVEGKYYTRTGSCNGCGQCCQNIALIHDGQVISRLSEFDALKEKFPEYAAFRVSKTDGEGLLFKCSHLQEDNSCGIYDNRPGFCRNYPDETGLILGGKLPSECSYQFKLKQTFDEVLKKNSLEQPEQAEPG